jgi:hypothetical protein
MGSATSQETWKQRNQFKRCISRYVDNFVHFKLISGDQDTGDVQVGKFVQAAAR